MSSNILFCTEKWCAGRPDLGLTISFQHLFDTFSRCYPEQKYNTIHLDEAGTVYNTHVDEILIKYCMAWNVEIIIFSLLGDAPVNPTLKTYKALKDLGIYTCFMWPDTNVSSLNTINGLQGLSDLHVSLDNPASEAHDGLKKLNNHIGLWTAKDSNLYYNQEGKDINVSFVGSTVYPDRIHFLQYLKDSVLDIHIGGGQREEKLTRDKYADLIRRSKIGINFAISPDQTFYQTKGRVFEIMLSGSMLLEFKNPATSRLFTPDVDYVEFSDKEDLLDKIKYYLGNEDERLKIAEQGYRTCREKYSPQIFWDTVMDRVKC